MIYIGNDSYIDISLITCAEYQLFIDEQRLDGYSLQPDHWRKVSYSSGMGRTPILGVRPSDALEFCTWLTKRDLSNWQYRLPTLNDYVFLKKNNSFVLPTEAEVGCWIDEGENFVWLRDMSPPVEPITDVIQEIFNRENMIVDLAELNRKIRHNLPLRIKDTLNPFESFELNEFFSPVLSHASILKNARYYNHAYAHKLIHDITNAREYINDCNKTLKQEFLHILSRDSMYTLDVALSSLCSVIKRLNSIRKIELDGHELLTTVYDYYLEIAVTLAMLMARIEGKLQAKEGILIAKQRQKTSTTEPSLFEF